MNILNFCSRYKGELRPWVKYPWYLDGNVVATDSRILISTRDIGPWQIPTEKFPIDDARELLSKIYDQEFEPLDKKMFMGDIGKICRQCNGIGMLHIRHCPECDDKGTLGFESDYNSYVVDCQSCRGNGGVRIAHARGEAICDECGGFGSIHSSVNIDGVLIPYKHLQKILQIENLEISADAQGRRLFFKGDGDLVGIAMGTIE